MQIRRRQVESAAIHIGAFLRKSVGSGTHNTAIDHKRVERRLSWKSRKGTLRLTEDRQFSPIEGGRRTIREPDFVMLSLSACHHANAFIPITHHLRSHRNDSMKL